MPSPPALSPALASPPPQQSRRTVEVAPTPHTHASAPDDSNDSKPDYIADLYRTDVRFENDGTGERTLTVRIHLLTEAGARQFEDLVFDYNSDSQKVDVAYVRVTKPSGKVVRSEILEDVAAAAVAGAPAYRNLREKRVSVPGLSAGDTLEYQVRTRTENPPAPGQFWFNHNFSQGADVLDEQLIVNVPKDRKLQIKTSPREEPERHNEGDREILTWKRSHVAQRDVAHGKSKSEPEAKPEPVELTTFTNWQEVAHWYAARESTQTRATPKIQEKVKELTGGKQSQQEKAEALYEYVAQKIRTVDLPFGAAGFAPHAGVEVMQNGYGDSEDKHTLLAALLECAGIHAQAALILSSRNMDAESPLPSQFSGILPAIALDGSLVWSDPTSAAAPLGYLAPELRSREVLVAVEGDARNGKPLTTPADPPFPASQQVEITGNVSDLGTLAAHVRYHMRGDNEYTLRKAFLRTKETDWKQIAQTVLLVDGLRGEIESAKPSDPTAVSQPFALDVDYVQPDFLDWSAKRARLALPLPALGIPDAPEGQSQAVHLGSPLTVVLKLNLALPAKDSVMAPAGMSVERDYAGYRSSYEIKGHQLIAQRTLEFKAHDIPAERKDDYRGFTHAIDSDEAQAAVVENPSASAAIPDSATAKELAQTGTAMVQAGNAPRGLPLLQRAVELDPKQTDAWGSLGLACLRTANWNGAIEAFQKQVELDPHTPAAHNYLGIAYAQSHRYGEAEAAFRKQIELDPLDASAHLSLGELLLTEKKDAEAATELDKAAILKPDSAAIQIGLGKALLGSGKDTEALTAFEKAAQISPAPGVWNSAARELAGANVHLEKAQSYAEQAVRAGENQLRDADLDHVTSHQLDEVATLASYWDTLGWIYFKRGDNARAWKFVGAAWLLGQQREAHDHLAQLYEKEGKDPAAASREPRFLLGHAIPESGRGEFLLLLVPSSGGATAQSVKFLGGTDKLRLLSTELESVNYGHIFPDGNAAKLIRKGVVTCAADQCGLVLEPATTALQN